MNILKVPEADSAATLTSELVAPARNSEEATTRATRTDLCTQGLTASKSDIHRTDEPLRIRDRIRELRRVQASTLLPNPKNWRRHPKAQANAMRDLLFGIGYADALLARELPDGRLMLIDGHLRKETTPDAQVPVLVLDVTEEEADQILLTLDPLAAMAEADAERIKALLTTVRTDSEAVQELLRRSAGPKLW